MIVGGAIGRNALVINLVSQRAKDSQEPIGVVAIFFNRLFGNPSAAKASTFTDSQRNIVRLETSVENRTAPNTFCRFLNQPCHGDLKLPQQFVCSRFTGACALVVTRFVALATLANRLAVLCSKLGFCPLVAVCCLTIKDRLVIWTCSAIVTLLSAVATTDGS